MRYMICMRAKDTWSNPDPKEEADILLIDTDTNVKASDGFMFVSGVKVKKIATTRTWNVQQGCMAQWLGPDFSSRIVYNDMRDGRYCSVIYELATGKEHILPMPVYTVSQNAKIALSLDFHVYIIFVWAMVMQNYLKLHRGYHCQIPLLFGRWILKLVLSQSY